MADDDRGLSHSLVTLAAGICSVDSWVASQGDTGSQVLCSTQRALKLEAL